MDVLPEGVRPGEDLEAAEDPGNRPVEDGGDAVDGVGVEVDGLGDLVGFLDG